MPQSAPNPPAPDASTPSCGLETIPRTSGMPRCWCDQTCRSEPKPIGEDLTQQSCLTSNPGPFPWVAEPPKPNIERPVEESASTRLTQDWTRRTNLSSRNESLINSWSNRTPESLRLWNGHRLLASLSGPQL
ncbi:hypothetical protein QAD02_013466 [Eretmocerus hayati]|uniref:Uncharacterized protein n=1 Tax=Eretmocerus hayati TaxID=131215 RepID=A0ACC2P282_9HYME|nr:hypothetical protein QAD02_013466 [Eretmocerus hayati]